MISVIVPIYKVEDYLRRCVDSLLGQTYREFELILVDDGSPDGCGTICDAYAAKDPRVRVIHKENGGLSDARNAGLEIAQGDYIAFVDSDDWVSPRYLERLTAGLEATGSDICECEIFRTAGASCPEDISDSAPEIYETLPALEQLIADGKFHQYVWNKLYRRETIGQIRFPKGKTNEDEFWTYQVFGRAGRVAKIDGVLYHYFQRPGSIMGAGFSLKRLDALEAKQLRQVYMEQNFPPLAAKSKVNLHISCMYSAQMALKHLAGADRQQAMGRIDRCVKAYPLSRADLAAVSGGSRLWLALSKVSFRGTCRLRNALRRGM